MAVISNTTIVTFTTNMAAKDKVNIPAIIYEVIPDILTSVLEISVCVDIPVRRNDGFAVGVVVQNTTCPTNDTVVRFVLKMKDDIVVPTCREKLIVVLVTCRWIVPSIPRLVFISGVREVLI